MTAERARLILNPTAGADRALATAGRLNERLREKYGTLEIVVSIGPADCEAAARRAVEDGCTLVFVGGGDGTLNEAINGVASAGALGRVTFGVVPLGTGNDFARALGISTDVEEAIATLLEGRTIAADIGRVNGRLFVNTSSGGFIGEVSEAVTPQLKSLAGRLAYLIGGAQALLEFEPVGLTLRADPGELRVGCGMYAYAACNSRLIGGGRLIAPHALIDDGLLDFCVIEAMSALEFAALARRVADGDHVQDDRVRYFRAARATLQFERPIRVNTDGEVFLADECTYDVLHRAARFFAGEAPFAGEETERSA